MTETYKIELVDEESDKVKILKTDYEQLQAQLKAAEEASAILEAQQKKIAELEEQTQAAAKELVSTKKTTVLKELEALGVKTKGWGAKSVEVLEATLEAVKSSGKFTSITDMQPETPQHKYMAFNRKTMQWEEKV